MTDSPVAANIMVLQDWPTAWQQASSSRLRRALRSSPGSIGGLRPDWGLSASIIISCPTALSGTRVTSACGTLQGVHPAKTTFIQGLEEDSCCYCTHGSHKFSAAFARPAG